MLVIGDSCVDRFVYGTCDRLSPEAPVPVLEHVKTIEMPGMAGNVAKNVEAFTKNVTLISQESESIKTRYVDIKSNQQIIRFDTSINTNRNYDFFVAAKTQEDNDALTSGYDIVILSDYDKGFLRQEQICRFTEKLSKTIYADSKKESISCFKNSIIKLNKKEFNSAGHTLNMSSTIVKTMGSNGASCNGQIYPSERVEVFDVSGAGDTFLVAFAVYHTLTKDIGSSIKFANKCAGIVVQRKGTYAIRNEDILQNV